MTFTSAVGDSTSARGAMIVRPMREPALIGLMLIGLGTSTTVAPPSSIQAIGLHGNTSSGLVLSDSSGAIESLTELRLRSGLTWEQISRLFGVSRRALHFWASGKAMTPANQEHLQRVLAALRRIDRGSPTATRTVLLDAGLEGLVPFDLLRAGHYDRAIAVTNVASYIDLSNSRMPSRKRSAKAPLPPDALVDALQDRPVGQFRAVRAASSVRIRRG